MRHRSIFGFPFLPARIRTARIIGAFAGALCVFSSISCSARETAPLPPLDAGEVSGARLWERIAEERPFAEYPAWPDYEGLQPGQSPHGRFHRIYITPVLADALPIPENVAPPGSIIVKENYDPDREVSNYTVMAKVEGYNPTAGDWFWAMYDPNGAVLAEGAVPMCIDCHTSSASDYVLLQRLDFNPVAEP